MSATLSEQRNADPAHPPASTPAVSVRNVSKSFDVPHEQYHTLKERALHPFRKRSGNVLRALEDVSVDIAPGEFFGVVGRNGSGKSTLLKCLAGIYKTDGGAIEINGRLSPFIELGVGFNPDLPARDNVIINAIMLGLSRTEALARFDDIIAFAELEDFIDLKLKNYSSGMYVRLAFATAVQVDADILLIDEVLAVGDAAFQQKCFDEFTRVRESGQTMVFVTHDMGAVERYCNRAMLLDHGRVVDLSDPVSIARQYNELNFARLKDPRSASKTELEVSPADTDGMALRSETPTAQIISAWFESETGEVTLTTPQRSECVARMEVRFLADVEEPIFGVRLQNERGDFVFAANSVASGTPTGVYRAGETAHVRLRFENWLAPGRYLLVATVARPGLGADLLDTHMSSSVIVLANNAGGGLTDLPHTLEVDRR